MRGLNSSAAAVAALWNHVALAGLTEVAERDWPEITAEDAADLIAVLQQLGGSE